MKLLRLTYLLLFIFSFIFLTNCSDSNDDPRSAEEILAEIQEGVDEETEEDTTENENSNLAERYVFDGNIVIENSYNTGGCDSPPCDTNDESLVGVFDNQVPDDPYFYLSGDQSELNLKCQLEKGRRIEFKQRSEGSLTSFSQLALEGTYYDIPSNGVTIAQVHNRGGNSNKPFFRLVLHNNGLETVIRKDPEVSSSDTSFQKEDYSFVDNAIYDGSPLKVTVEKSSGLVHIKVIQNEVTILDESFAPDTSTKWVTDSGIANGFYLKAGLYNDDGPHTKDLVVGYNSVMYESDDD